MNTAKRINQMRNTPGIPVWQRNYWEHVIRSEDSLNKIRDYIINNPWRWHLDQQNPNRTGEDDFDRWLEGHLLTMKQCYEKQVLSAKPNRAGLNSCQESLTGCNEQ